MNDRYNIFSLEHPERSLVSDEISVVISLKKEKESIGLKVKEKYNKENFPDNFGLTENCIIIRKHKERDCIKLMEKWWEEIEKYSHRDQLSFSYAQWKTGVKNKIISKSFALDYFEYSFHLKDQLYQD